MSTTETAEVEEVAAVAAPAPPQMFGLGVFADWRMPKIILLGIISGFPWVLIGSMMTLWLKEEGFSRSGIGLFGIVFTVYAFNLLWAPIVDTVRLPFLSRFGQRRSWIVLMQILIIGLMLAMSTLNPTDSIVAISALAFFIALFSATQDVAVDALRIELIGEAEPNKVGAGSAMATSGWWIGYGGFGAFALVVAEIFEERGMTDYWATTYMVMIGVIVLCVALLLLFVREPASTERVGNQDADAGRMREMLAARTGSLLAPLANPTVHKAIVIVGLLAALFSFQFKGTLVPEQIAEQGGGWASFFYLWVTSVVVAAIAFAVLLAVAGLLTGSSGTQGLAANAAARAYSIWYMPAASFLRRHGVRIGLIIIALVFLFKVGEAFLGRMSLVFYKEVGFTKSDIALYSKGYGTIALVAFTIVGSLINARYGLFRGLLIGGIAMASTNLLFAALAVDPATWLNLFGMPDADQQAFRKGLFATAVVTDQFTTAMSTVALVAFLSQLCDRTYTATQYAALASLGNFSRTTLAVGSGVVVDALGGNWAIFFIITTVMVVPSLILLLYVRKDIEPLMQGQTTKLL